MTSEVTNHRVVLSLSATQSTLWDQFTYTGSPSEFSWILPVRNAMAARVRVGDDRFINDLNTLTRPLLNAPALPASCGTDGGAVADVPPPIDAPVMEGGVMVMRQDVVGPYNVATIRGMDPMAIQTWLTMNGFAIPSEAVPVLMAYATSGHDFIVAKLRPGMGINRMAPIRVTVPTMWNTLPLRMIAAGARATVNVSLWVFASGRIESMNYPNREIRESDLSYDFNAPTVPQNDFDDAFTRLNGGAMGRLFLTESSDIFARNFVEASAERAMLDMPREGSVCPAGSSMGDAGGACSEPDAVDDARTAFEGVGMMATVTRLRAAVTPMSADMDLTLQASMAGSRQRTYAYGNVTEPASCRPDVQPDVIDATAPDGDTDGGVPDADANMMMVFDVPISEVSPPDVVIPPDIVDVVRDNRYIAAGGCTVARTGAGSNPNDSERSPAGLLVMLGGVAGAVALGRRVRRASKRD